MLRTKPQKMSEYEKNADEKAESSKLASIGRWPVCDWSHDIEEEYRR
jgi:hypothetical protein